MGNLKEEAQSYEKPKSLTIADLEIVSVEVDVKNGVGQDREGKDYDYKYIIVDEKEYRVPNSVLEQLKVQTTENPELSNFKVTKEGEGYDTKYTVVPLKN